MDLGLKGKVALVAAASRGLGRAVAEELAAEGAVLVLCSRNAQTIKQTANEIAEATGADVLALAADVSQVEDVVRLVQSGIERFGRIDILVTNAGGPPAGPFESFSLEQWEAATRLTLFSAIELARNVLPGMKERRWGRILNITSIAVKQPVENLILSTACAQPSPDLRARWPMKLRASALPSTTSCLDTHARNASKNCHA
jgi:3-oxoacyl-[acyl-carrier protein] reductase